MIFQRKIGWLELLFPWLAIFVMYAVSMLVNIVLGAAIGAMGGWIVSQFLLGNWILDGLHSLNINVARGDLYKLGSAAGFLVGLTKGQFAIGPLARAKKNSYRDTVL